MRNITNFLLARIPDRFKPDMRKLTPQWAYQAVARMAAGKPLLSRAAQIFLSDSRVAVLENRLWRGFSGVAVDDLESLLRRTSSRQQAAEAAMVLARFYAANKQYAHAVDCVRSVRGKSHALGRHKRVPLIEIHALLELGRLHEARCIAERAILVGDTDDGCLNAALASVAIAEARAGLISEAEAAERYLACINRPLQRSGFVGLALRDMSRPLAIDNLTADSTSPLPDSAPAKVSVLMAVYNGADHVGYAVRGVLDQTWRNLELIIVDDASTDDSWKIIQQLAEQDERIVAVHHSANGGAYAARNTALAWASGDFVAVNDADDWAHPQKLEVQITAMLNGDAPANLCSRLRVARDMRALPRLDSPYVPMIHVDYSSLMVARDQVMRLGGWDRVRSSADAELMERLRAVHGEAAVSRPYEGVPLSFSLLAEKNLTASSATNIATYRFGGRQEYVRQYREWHRSGESLEVVRRSQVSPFPVPGIGYYGAGHVQRFDFVLVSDFSRRDSLQRLRGQGGKTAILPWPWYEADGDIAFSDDVSRLCRQLGVVTLAHGDQVQCALLVIDRPVVMAYALDRLPTIKAEEVCALDGEGCTAAQRRRMETNILAAFGTHADWINAAELQGWIQRLTQ